MIGRPGGYALPRATPAELGGTVARVALLPITTVAAYFALLLVASSLLDRPPASDLSLTRHLWVWPPLTIATAVVHLAAVLPATLLSVHLAPRRGALLLPFVPALVLFVTVARVFSDRVHPWHDGDLLGLGALTAGIPLLLCAAIALRGRHRLARLIAVRGETVERERA